MVEYLTPNSFIEEVEMDQERIDDERVDPPVPAELGECEECGECMEKCPQDIEVIEQLKETAAVLGD